jgi:flagellar biosynthetic protein FlhB
MNDREEDPSDKPHDPTQARLEEARRKGDAPRSLDLAGAGSLAGLALAVGAFGSMILDGAGGSGQLLLGSVDRTADVVAEGAKPVLWAYLQSALVAAAPLFLLPFVGAVAAVAAQGPVVFVAEKLAPKLERISPIAGFRSRFGSEALLTFAKNVGKLLLVSTVLGLVLAANLEAIIAAVALEARPGSVLLLSLLVQFLFWILAIQAVVAIADVLLQRRAHRRKLRMSDRDLRDEIKEHEGNPQLRAERRRRAVSIATNRMLQDVATSDVVIVNPTHYAVALRWDRAGPRAPICVAKGTDEIAARIRERAAAAGVPIRRDPPTARALHATVGIGEEIRPDHYRAVAAAIRFAEAIRSRARARDNFGSRRSK